MVETKTSRAAPAGFANEKTSLGFGKVGKRFEFFLMFYSGNTNHILVIVEQKEKFVKRRTL